MVQGMGLWGVPSYRLCGPEGEPDLEVWGQGPFVVSGGRDSSSSLALTNDRLIVL